MAHMVQSLSRKTFRAFTRCVAAVLARQLHHGFGVGAGGVGTGGTGTGGAGGVGAAAVRAIRALGLGEGGRRKDGTKQNNASHGENSLSG